MAHFEGDVSMESAKAREKLLMPDGIVFDGSWSDGQINGMGKLISLMGIPEGMLVNGSRQRGRVVYANGDVYDGNRKRSASELGHLSGQDGYSYIGNWSSGQMEGAGEVVYPDGSIYIGNFTAEFKLTRITYRTDQVMMAIGSTA